MAKFTQEGWIEVEITPQMIKRARKKAKSMGVLNNSIRKGDGNLCGFLGEEIFLKAFKDSTETNDYQHDIKMFGKLKVEIKTKDRTVRPQPYYECSVARYNDTQETHAYVFCSLLREGKDYKKGYILGYLTPKSYKAKAQQMKAGDFDPSNGMIFKANCLNVAISDLNNINKFCKKMIEFKDRFV